MTGVMPKWRQRFHTFMAGFLCILFAGVGLMSLRVAVQSGGGAAPVITGLLMTASALAAIVSQIWFRRRILSEFSYDGFAVQYRTLGDSQMHTVALTQVARVEPWRGRGGLMGYRIVYQGGRKIYLEYAVPNATAVAAALESAAKLNLQS